MSAVHRLASGLLPRLLTYTGVRPAFDAVARRIGLPFLVGVNYHWTAAGAADRLDAQLRHLAERFVPLDRPMLERFFAGSLTLDRPGVVVCFDDGNRNTYDVAAPLLERHGMRGWYFVVAGTLDPAFTDGIEGLPRRFAMTPDQLRDLHARGHTVGSHGYAHLNLGTVPRDRLVREVVGSREVIERAIGAPVDAFCYPFGTPDSFSPEAQALVQTTYRFAFNSCPRRVRPSDSPHAIGRHSVAPEMDVHRLRLKTSGLLDWRHRRKTRRFLASLPPAPGGRRRGDGAAR